jgi:hypothetical protein
LINEEWPSETGWGLYINQLGDNEHKVPVINWAAKTFTLMEEDLQAEVFSQSLDAFVSKYSSQPSMV